MVKPEDGLVSARVFVDPDVYQLELEHIFASTWLFLGHESELPKAGDFVTRRMGEDPVIVVRDDDGHIHVLLNVCRHRGRKLCSEDCGNTTFFRCGYHGWTYAQSGDLTGVPFLDAYQGRLDKRALGLQRAASVDTYHGLIFATWNPDCEPLREYLGDIAWTLDILFGRTDRMEVAGPPLRWLIDANWKLPVGNFAGDGHHLMTTHGFSGALGLKAKRASRLGYSVATANGHGAVLTNWAKETAHQPYLALASEVVPELERNLSAGQLLVLRDLQVIVGNIFPNMSFLDTASHSPAEWGGPEGLDMSFLTVRQWQPRGVGQLEVWSWLLLDKSAPMPWLEASTACYERVFGVAGVFEQDDTENWSSISSALRGPMARRLWADYRMGLGVSPSPEWIGQGQGYLQQGQFWEVNERNFYQRWRELMTRCSASG